MGPFAREPTSLLCRIAARYFPMTVRFCPQCGTKSVPQANFCAACGEALPGAGKGMSRRGDTSVSTSWRPLAPGLVVLSLYLVVGTGLWFFVLRSQPFPSV